MTAFAFVPNPRVPCLTGWMRTEIIERAIGCLYCYANYDMSIVKENLKFHNPLSPLLVGGINPEDNIKDARQESYIDNQLHLFILNGMLTNIGEWAEENVLKSKEEEEQKCLKKKTTSTAKPWASAR